jgi:hypothetical protein
VGQSISKVPGAVGMWQNPYPPATAIKHMAACGHQDENDGECKHACRNALALCNWGPGSTTMIALLLSMMLCETCTTCAAYAARCVHVHLGSIFGSVASASPTGLCIRSVHLQGATTLPCCRLLGSLFAFVLGLDLLLAPSFCQHACPTACSTTIVVRPMLLSPDT